MSRSITLANELLAEVVVLNEACCELEMENARLKERLTELQERIDRQAEIIDAQWQKHPEDAPVDISCD